LLLAPEREYRYRQLDNNSPMSGPEAVRHAYFLSKPLLVIMVMIAFLSGLFMTAKYVELSVLGNDINQLKKQIGALKKENEHLQLEIARLSSPERVAVIASTKLGMREPNVQQFRLVTPLPQQPAASVKLADEPKSLGHENSPKSEVGFMQIIAHMVSRWVGGISQVEASQL